MTGSKWPFVLLIVIVAVAAWVAYTHHAFGPPTKLPLVGLTPLVSEGA